MLTDLVLFRHGKAVRPYEARDDFSRGLTARGVNEAASQARRLKAAGFKPDVVLVSTALRAAQTWDAARPCFLEASVRANRALYLAAPEIYLSAARDTGAASILLIAHDPGLHELARRLMKGDHDTTAGQAELHAHLPTSGLAWFRRDTRAQSGFQLHQFWPPTRAADTPQPDPVDD